MKKYNVELMKSTSTVESIKIYSKGSCTLKYIRHWSVSFSYKLSTLNMLSSGLNPSP